MQSLLSTSGLLAKLKSLLSKILKYPNNSTKYLNGNLLWSSISAILSQAFSTASTPITDSASAYDIPGLSISNLLAGTYLITISIITGSKNGEVHLYVMDGSNNVLWPLSNNGIIETYNISNFHQVHYTGVITTVSTLTIRVVGAAAGSISNYTAADRHISLMKLA